MLCELGIRVLAIFLGLILVTGLFNSPIVFAVEASDQGGAFFIDGANPIDPDGGDPDTYTISRPIIYDPTAGPWIKVLDVSTGSTTKKMIEPLTVTAPSPPIADWHENIFGAFPPPSSAGGLFQTAKWVDCPVPGGPSIPPTVSGPGFSVSGMIMSSGIPGFVDDVVWFGFPEVSSPDMFTVEKCFEVIAAVSEVQIGQFPTIKDDKMAVGGEFIGIDTVSVLVAGTQTTAAWMIPVIVSAIGIGIVIARKF